MPGEGLAGEISLEIQRERERERICCENMIMRLLATCAHDSVTSNHGPCTIFSTRTIFPVRPSESPVGIDRRCGHISLRAPYGPLADTQGNWHNQNLQKSCTGVVCGRTSPYRPFTIPTRAVRGLFTISNPVCGPKAYHACIKIPRAPYGRLNSCGAAGARTGTVGDVRFLFKTPGNSPHEARECDMTGYNMFVYTLWRKIISVVQ